jgi:hypothetical protein
MHRGLVVGTLVAAVVGAAAYGFAASSRDGSGSAEVTSERRATPDPTPTATPQTTAEPARRAEGAPKPGTKGGPPLIERHVIHGSGPISVTSGVVEQGTEKGGSFSTRTPGPSAVP